MYASPNITGVMMMSRRMRWAGVRVSYGEKRNANRVLRTEPEGKIPFGRPGHRCEDNSKIDTDVV